MDIFACKPKEIAKFGTEDPLTHIHCPRLGGIGASGLEFHKWARKNNWRNPTDAKNSPLQQTYNTDKDAFEYLRSIGYGTQTNNHSKLTKLPTCEDMGSG